MLTDAEQDLLWHIWEATRDQCLYFPDDEDLTPEECDTLEDLIIACYLDPDEVAGITVALSDLGKRALGILPMPGQEPLL